MRVILRSPAILGLGGQGTHYRNESLDILYLEGCPGLQFPVLQSKLG